MSLTDEQRERLRLYRTVSQLRGSDDMLWLLDLVDSLEKENEQLRRSLAGRAAESGSTTPTIR